MNTGPIIGGSRDGEQHSYNGDFCNIPVPLTTARAIAFGTGPDQPEPVINTETLRFVPFHFAFRSGRNVTTGFWVVLNEENRTLYDDAEYRLFVLMKLSARYIEQPDAIKKRLFALYEAGRQ